MFTGTRSHHSPVYRAAVPAPVPRCPLPTHWGDSGGTPADKDGEIRVRMGNSRFQPWLGRGAATGVFSRGCVETKGFELAPQVGLEPTTLRLTAECSTIELLRSGGLFVITANLVCHCQIGPRALLYDSQVTEFKTGRPRCATNAPAARQVPSLPATASTAVRQEVTVSAPIPCGHRA